MPPWTETIARYLEFRLPEAGPIDVVSAGRLPAGASNATIAFDALFEVDGARFQVPLILRPQRQAGILAPYDVARQFRIMRSLATTPVPVPVVAWFEEDTSHFGAPFFLMSRLVGVRTPPLVWYAGSPLAVAAARTLAKIHALDDSDARISWMVTPGASPLASELAEWDRRAEYNGADHDPLLMRLRSILLENEPGDARLGLTHGDTNAGNYLFRGDEVAAVVDWELAALGDPRSDLGYYTALEMMFGGGASERGESVLSDAYERVTRQKLAHLDFYEAWGHYRMLTLVGGPRGGWWNPYGAELAIQRLDTIIGRGWRRR
jgi:aminoglycoside phosphotransferase (APT) family kinase protein